MKFPQSFFNIGLSQSMRNWLVELAYVKCEMLSVIFSGFAFATVEFGIFSKKDIDCESVATSSVTAGSDPDSLPEPPPQAERARQSVNKNRVL